MPVAPNTSTFPIEYVFSTYVLEAVIEQPNAQQPCEQVLALHW